MSARHALLPVAAVVFGLTACGSTPAPAPVPAALPSVATTSAAAATTSAAPADSAPAPARPAATQAPTPKAGTRAGECPSAKALEKLADLPKDWHFVASRVECWKEWATAVPEGPATGDGVYLFQYKAGSGWSYHSQGSGYHCKELGINEAAPFCQYP